MKANFTRKTLSYSAYLKLLGRTEAHLIDFKDKRIKPSKLCQTVSAFANADGGEIYVGIEEIKEKGEFKWSGFANEEEANPFIQVVEDMLYLNSHYVAEFLEYGKDGLVLKLIINKANKVIYTPEKKVFKRRSAQNLELKTHDDIRRLELNKGAYSHEDFPMNVDLKQVEESDIIYEFLVNAGFEMDPEDFLRKNNLVEEGKPKVSSILLFSDYPQAFIDRCGVKIIRYSTSADIPERKDMVVNPLSIEGCLYKQIYKAVDIAQEMIEKIPDTDSGEKVQYPLETLHEIITNAVLHRDYSIKDDIQIRIFNNRVEVQSPGILPGYITIQNILSQRFSRNGTLVRIINKFENPPNKDIGEGLNTAFDAMRESGLMYPRIKQQENSVLVVIPNEKTPDSTEVLLDYLDRHNEITSYEIDRRKIFKSDYYKAKTLKILKDNGVVENVAGKSSKETTYRLVSRKNRI
ncbi:ATP-binding protein [Leptolyngbya sp. CCNP1308]|uniref:ATP-binding protein n=1 Tax=Leptolyngbya sp. CCNP1308 TaxID=3110255 RepID=UPI002B1F49EB|nr:ATP-binding protein [Leptolyngbya sp. CCNP1308]MEA5450209.1 ATP-binding protein [Leptolyngbya sp. CCNP1308]